MLDWVKDKVVAVFAPKYIGSIVRSLLTVAAGWLVSTGVAQQGQADDFVKMTEPILIGVLTYAVTLVWSLVQKKNTEKLPPAKR